MQQKQNNHILSQELLFSPSVMSDSLQLHGLQRTRLPCPSSGACSNSCPLSQWSHPTISSSVAPFSSCSNQQWGKPQSNPIYTLKLLIVTAVCDTIISEGRGENRAKIRKVGWSFSLTRNYLPANSPQNRRILFHECLSIGDTSFSSVGFGSFLQETATSAKFRI